MAQQTPPSDTGPTTGIPDPTAEPDAAPTPPPAGQSPHGGRFFSWLRGLGLTRQPGWIGGVSVGIADRLGIDPLIVRGILIVVAIVGAPATLLYAIAWALLPDAKGRIHLEELVRGRFDTPMIGIAVLLAVSLLPVPQGIWSLGAAYWGQPYGGDSIGRAIWTLVLIGLVVWLMVWFIRRSNGASASPSAWPSASPNNSANATPAAPATPPAPASPLAYTGTILGTPGTERSIPPAAPPRPQDGATSEELASWRDSQAQWKLQYDAFRRQQQAERQAANAVVTAQARAERMARTAVYRDQRLRSRSHPIYSLVVIGMALVGGAITALAIGGQSPSVLQYLTGIGVAVGILGLGIVVNGIRGKRSGGASAVAVLLALPLLAGAIFPQTDRLHYSGDWMITPVLTSAGSNPRYVQGFGAVTIDLSHYYDGSPAKPSEIYTSLDFFVASGNVTVIMPPTDATTNAGYIEAQTGNGTVRALNVQGSHSQSRFMSLDSTGSTGDPDTLQRRIAVNVYSGSGDITIINAPQDSE